MSTSIQPNSGEDLIRIHKAITRGIDVSINHSQGCGPQIDLRPGFLTYVHALTIVLHGHHSGEDDISFPFWKAKNPVVPVEQLMDEHRHMVFQIEKIEAWVNSGEAAWQPGTLSTVHGALTALGDLWSPHIALEEAVMGPEMAEQMLTPEENEVLGIQLSQHGQQHAQPGELALPFVLYNLAGNDRAAMQQAFPPVIAQQLIPIDWKPVWLPMQPFLLG